MSFARLRIAGDSVFMKEIQPKLTSSIDVKESMKKNDVVNFQSKNFDKVFHKFSKTKTRYGLEKFSIFEDEFGIVDIDRLDNRLMGEYLIDNDSEIKKTIEFIHITTGYKFKHVSELRQHTMCVLLNKFKGRFSKEVLFECVKYFFEKKWKSYQERSKRFLCKAFGNRDIWNHFVTLTYDSELLTEDEFVKKFKKYLANYACSGVKYMGVIERSDKGRLHFHCLMHCTEDMIQDLDLVEEEYYDKKHGKRATTLISNNLRNRFGRCEFKEIDPYDNDFNFLLTYLCKYILKQDNKLVYSRGLPEEAICEIDDFENSEIGILSTSSTFSLMKNDCDYHLCRFINTSISE